MKTKTFLTLLVTTLAVRTGLAGDGEKIGSASPRLSLGEITRVVLENNPAIKEAENRWSAAEQRMRQATAWDDPRLAGESRVRRFVNVPPNAFMDQTISIEQLIPITGKNLVRGRAAAAEALSIFEEVRRTKLDVIAKARGAYFRLANAYDQLDINDKTLTSLRQIADISRTRYETGLESAANVLVAETDHSKLLETRRDLERNLSDAQSQLNALMNRDAFAPLGPPIPAAINESNLSLTKLRAITLAQRPEVQMARAKIDNEKSKLDLARREWIPDPALMAKAQRYNDTSKAVSEVDAGVSFTVPWVNPLKYSAGVREARANVAAAEQGFAREQTEALRLLRDQLEKIETAHHHVDLFRDKLVPQARQAFEATRLSYESGKATFLDWISAQRNLRDIEATARERLSDYQVAVAELEAVIGADIYSASPSSSRERRSR
ncbi:MAG TPA: TolC family protein [Chthoniobacterales bacterium]|nr:TolC family protein [Chthoniobacterales bacterium]